MQGTKMKIPPARQIPLAMLFVAVVALLYAIPSRALDVSHYRAQFSVFTKHYEPKPYHVNQQNLVNFEWWLSNGWHGGVALFDNSYGQFSQYVYAGRTYRMGESGLWYGRVTAGLIRGYKKPYKDKIPLNGLGIAPAIVPALGFRHKWLFTEVQILGLSAAMITLGTEFR